MDKGNGWGDKKGDNCKERVRDFFAGPEKGLFRLFFTFFQSHSHRYAPEKIPEHALKGK